ncbi:hypothetical protein CY0110_16052 [Crocosphaera chwakensis CCY0110]|uniref:Uncharacterized protein n=1 Tax=Crocosphaera chwakensis CCY0110 TaxID=391612 RepID=A3IHP2_9CHRO|nr:hypothetical protein CY0110_16052 [Crocosphaera chwakensis CCY0110]
MELYLLIGIFMVNRILKRVTHNYGK